MLARIFTRLFWAAIFFALGVWAGPRLGGLDRYFDQGFAGVKSQAIALWAWSEENLSPGGGMAKRVDTPAAPEVPAKPVPAPAVPSPAAVAPAPAATAPAEKAASAATQSAPAPTAPATIAAARAAHARGDVIGAVAIYEAVLLASPEDDGAAGELGNVLWAAGRTKEAASAYHRAALALIAKGRAVEAVALLEPIRRGDASLGDDLDARLARAGVK